MKKLHLFAAIAAVACTLVACTKEQGNDTPAATVSVSPATVTFESDGGTLKAAVTTNQDTYSVSGAPQWISIAQNGKEISLTAQANTETSQRSASLKITAGDASCTLTVNQKPGSPYPGYTVMSKASFEYAGTQMYQWLKPAEGYDGGLGYIVMEDEDGNTLSVWAYSELFLSEEDVELTTGTYTLGEDTYPSLVAKKLTYMAGFPYVADDEDEDFAWGTYYTDAATGKITLVKGGTIEVSDDEDGMVIKADLKGEDGEEIKLVYTGTVQVTADGATYPSESDRIDVSNTVFEAQCAYLGDNEQGQTQLNFFLYSGDKDDEENAAMTLYSILVPHFDFSEDYDLSGSYSTSTEDDEEEYDGVIVPGSMVDYGGFSFPSGTYVMYSFGDYLIGDGFDSLILTKQDDGEYVINGAIMPAEGNDFVMFLNIKLPVKMIDGSGLDDED